MTASIVPPAKTQFFDANGNPLALGTVGMYVPATLTFKNTWQDTAQTVLNVNPVVLDAAGEALILGDGSYRQIVKDVNGLTIWDQETHVITAASVGISDPMLPVVGASSTAAALVLLGGTPTLANIAALHAYNATTPPALVYVEGYYAAGDGGEGAFAYIATDTTSTDNGGTIIVDFLSRRWHREISGDRVLVQWFGAKGDGTTNDAAAINRAMAASLAVRFPRLATGAQAVYAILSVLTLRAGHLIEGDGAGGTIIEAQTGGQIVFRYTSVAASMARVSVRNLAIRGAAATVVGISSELGDEITVRDVEFLGCEGDCVKIDRGYFSLVENCASRPNATGSRKAGGFHFFSSDVADFCFNPVVNNCHVHTQDELGVSVGVVSSRCVHFFRVIQGMILNLQAERLNMPSANVTDGIWIEGNCQGCNIIGGATHGAKSGVVMFLGSGVDAAPGYCAVVGHAVDFFSTSGVTITGTVSLVCVDLVVGDCIITAPQGGAIGIDVSNTIRCSIDSNTIDQYGAQGGVGIEIGASNGAQIIANAINNMTTGITLFGADNVNAECAHNIVTNCVSALTGDLTAGGFGSNAFRDNRGINPMTISTPGMLASGDAIGNTTGIDVMVYPVGGTTVTWQINGVSVGQVLGGLFVPADGTISVAYAVAPTWTWVGN